MFWFAADRRVSTPTAPIFLPIHFLPIHFGEVATPQRNADHATLREGKPALVFLGGLPPVSISADVGTIAAVLVLPCAVTVSIEATCGMIRKSSTDRVGHRLPPNA